MKRNGKPKLNGQKGGSQLNKSRVWNSFFYEMGCKGVESEAITLMTE